MTVTNMRIMIRRDTEAMWFANGDNVLLEGEIGYELDSRRMKIGYQSKAYSELPYFAGGIVDLHPDGGLKLDEAGMLYLDNDMVLGELPADTNIKSYVDGLIQGEGAIRSQEDQLLSNRIDGTNANLATETSNRQGADSALQQQITALQTSVGEDIGDIPSGTSVKTYVDGKVAGETQARMAADTVHNTQLNNRYTKAETYSKTEVDTALAGKADLTGADFTGPVSATEFQGPLNGNVENSTGTGVLLDNTAGTFTGDTFGVSTGQHFGPVFKADTQATPVVVLNPGTGTAAVATYEGDLYKQGGMVKMVDSVAGTFNGAISGDVTGNITGDLTGNTEGTHKGDVVDADGNVIVDVANANFNGNVLGNLTGNTVGSHYGNVYNDATDVLLIDGSTGNFVGTDLALSGNAGIAGTLQVTSAAAFANTVEVEELLHAKKDLIADGAGAVGGGLQVGEQVLARSARLNDNPAGPDDATEIPFMAVEDSDVVTKKFYMEHGPSRVGVNRHVISSIDSTGSDGLIWDAATEATIPDGTIVWDLSKGAVYIRLIEPGTFDGYARISA